MPESPQPENNQERRSEQIKPLRTLEGDVAEVLGQEKTSATQIIAAESERPREESVRTVLEPTEPANPASAKILGIVSIIIVLAGIVGFGEHDDDTHDA